MTEATTAQDDDDTAGTSGVPLAAVVTQADPQYADCVRGLNTRYIGTPESVRIVKSTKQVVQVVQEAVTKGKRLTVISSGHCYEDFIFNPDIQVVIDMSLMKDVSYDLRMNAFAVESGATVLGVYTALYKEWGVTIPAGFCYSVAMGGHVSGGGWGPLSRIYGLVVDHLYAVEVVVVDASGTARAVVATREADDPHRDLWWAHTGGGGGNFGVVTRYWFRSHGAKGSDPRKLLPRPPHDVLLSAISFAWSDISEAEFARLARNYASWHIANRAPDNPNRALTSYLLLNHVSNGQIGLITEVDATVPGAQTILDDYITWIRDGISVEHGPLTNRMADIEPMPELVEARRLPWLQKTRLLGTTNPPLNDPTYRADYKSTYMRGNFPDNQVAELYQHLTSTAINNPLAGVQFTPYGGQISAVTPDATASVHRGAAFKILWTAQWTDPDQDTAHIDWMRQGYQKTYADTGGVPVPNDVTDGCYVNYPDADLSDPQFNQSSYPWHALYYKDNYPRLQKIKKHWDPRNFFRHRQSIHLP